MRIAIVADSHYDETSRFDECVRVHEWIAADLEERGVELVLHSGDVFERRSTPAERRAVADWLGRVTARAPVVIVRGNHDAVGDLALFERLRARHPVTVEEAIGVRVVAGAAIACVAWPRKAELLALLGADADQERSGEIATTALRDIIRGFRGALEAHDGPRILLAHAMVDGSVTSTGQPLVGCDMSLDLSSLGLAGASLVALGHIHKGQEWAIGDVPVVYPGSPRRSNFGELEPKGYVVAEFDGARLVGWERVETPATPMVHVGGCWTGADLDVELFPADPILAGAEVRLRYSVPSDARAAARARAEAWSAAAREHGRAVSIKIEEQIEALARARAPEIAASPTLPDKLDALGAARGEELGERRERLVGKALELERESA